MAAFTRTAKHIHECILYIFSTGPPAQTEPLILVMLEWYCALLFGLSVEILTLHFNLCIFLSQRDSDVCLSLYIKHTFEKKCQKDVGGGGFRMLFVQQALQLKPCSDRH